MKIPHGNPTTNEDTFTIYSIGLRILISVTKRWKDKEMAVIDVVIRKLWADKTKGRLTVWATSGLYEWALSVVEASLAEKVVAVDELAAVD